MTLNRRKEKQVSIGGGVAPVLVLLGVAVLSLAAMSGPSSAAPLCECEDTTTVETTVPTTTETIPETIPETTSPSTPATSTPATAPDTSTAVLPATTEFVPARTGELPTTGVSTVPGILVGVLLVGAGAVVLTATARRRTGDA